jgi:sec-independent protein translocase protein TatB
MEIFGIGPAELILILVIAFVVLGPDRLPAAARTLGQWVRQLRKLTNELSGQLGPELNEAKQELQATQQELRGLSSDLTNQLQAGLADVKQDLQATQEEMRQAGQTFMDAGRGEGLTSVSPPVTWQGPATNIQDESELLPEDG